MKARDIDIRYVLHEKLNKQYGNDEDTVILDELVVCQGEACVDVAVINGTIIGYEIKSERDSLDRLPNQINAYNKVFDIVSIITGNCHLDKISSIVPDWWGIYLAISTETGLEIKQVRSPKPNKNVEAFALAQFLWREEILNLLSKYNLDKGIKRLPKFKLWPYIAENIPLDELKEYVRSCLKSRKELRALKNLKSNTV
ncbi:hypothetical protein BBF96_03240 [Anoxybacter fermentans]|uniref:Sce7726 family protein n=1 Tax=Anoxybacter fermentans TaxID=1323375 RepID=A0A3Q9HQQ6_9FIRM|nr:sce7726 family protein [Anoxybacter fermentans]AZR72479.1 hypothetical protein BBF96_03240 [Anoxybacter fermentans]